MVRIHTYLVKEKKAEEGNILKSFFMRTHQVQHVDVVVGKDAYYLLGHAGTAE